MGTLTELDAAVRLMIQIIRIEWVIRGDAWFSVPFQPGPSQRTPGSMDALPYGIRYASSGCGRFDSSHMARVQ